LDNTNIINRIAFLQVKCFSLSPEGSYSQQGTGSNSSAGVQQNAYRAGMYHVAAL